MSLNKEILLSLYFTYDLFFNDDDDDKKKIIKIYNYAEKIVPRMNTKQFKANFRLEVNTFEDLLGKCATVYEKKLSCGNKGLDFEKQLLIFIWYLANIECFRSVSERFGVSQSTAWESVYKCCKIIIIVNKKYGLISWPERERAQYVERSFLKKARFTGCLGAIDGSHIPIRAPSENSNSYVNRKGFHSVVLQAVCADEYLFTDCYVGEVGSVHDACVFRRSSLSRKLLKIDANCHILGDSAYKLTQHLMVPYKDNGHLTNREINYNKAHAKTRVVIEQTFALLKGRFRRLKLLENTRLDIITALVMSACVLHNVCQLNGDNILNEINFEMEIQEEQMMNPIVINNNQDQLGHQKRNRIAETLLM